MSLCTYCPKGADTRDHIPPLCFFPGPRPAELLTVPCCRSCNQTAGADDEQMRNLLAALEDSEGHEAIHEYLRPKMHRSFQRHQGKGSANSKRAFGLWTSTVRAGSTWRHDRLWTLISPSAIGSLTEWREPYGGTRTACETLGPR